MIRITHALIFAGAASASYGVIALSRGAAYSGAPFPVLPVVAILLLMNRPAISEGSMDLKASELRLRKSLGTRWAQTPEKGRKRTQA